MAEMGRPTLYLEEYVQDILNYFNQQACEFETVENSKGDMVRIVKPCSLPTMAGYACKIGVHRETLLNWAKEHGDFFDAIKRCKDHQERILVENGLMGGYDKTFAIFTAKNLIDWRDKTEVAQTTTLKATVIAGEMTAEDAAKVYKEMMDGA